MEFTADSLSRIINIIVFVVVVICIAVGSYKKLNEQKQEEKNKQE